MALDVWIGRWDSAGSTLVVSFEPEAYYWVIYPLIEALGQSHGKYIDLYGGTEFPPDQLSLVTKLVDEAEELVSSQPSRFEVHTGAQTEPVRHRLYSTVERASFLRFLAKLRSVVQRCEQTQKPMLFYGD